MEIKKHIIEKAFLIRTIENKLLSLYADGKLNGTVHTCIGQELIGVIVSEYLSERDFVLSNHRGHGHYIAQTNDVNGLISEVLGRKTGSAMGVGGSQHLTNKNYISNGIQGGMVPIAAGIALDYKLTKQDAIAVIYIGDGTLGEGIIYEAFNICSIWNLPILFILENNGYAQSTSFKQTFSGNTRKRIEGFGIKYYKTDSNDIADLNQKIKDGVAIARSQQACMVEVKTSRLYSHSKGDDNRSDDEIADCTKKDILSIILNEKLILSKNDIENIKDKVNKIADDCEKAPILDSFENIESHKFYDYTYEELSKDKSDYRYNELIYQALDEQMSKYEDIIIIGEDIEYINEYTPKPYGGAFKVTKDLSSKFPGRVRNTPISESAIVGLGTGMALRNRIAIVEIMFGDFLSLAFDQIVNHATKFVSMYGKEKKVPLIIRTPMGGRRGYGPTHSQSLEKFFLGIPNLNVIALNKFVNPKLIYKNLIENINIPTLVIENKALYAKYLNSGLPIEYDLFSSNELFPTIKIKSGDMESDVTIFCYGDSIDEVLSCVVDLFYEEEILCDIIMPTLINPINIKPIYDSVMKTKKLLIIEEGTNVAALGAEVISALMEKENIISRVIRYGNNNIIPSSHNAEKTVLPNQKTIKEKVIELHEYI